MSSNTPMEKRYKLVVRRGRRPGRSVTLDRNPVRIGSSRECALRIRGDHVADVHAEVVPEDGRWLIRNRSVNGTFVNQRLVDVRELVSGDLVQIGAETLVELVVEERSRRIRRSRKPRSSARTGKSVLQRPAVLTALGVYAAGIVAACLFFAGGAGRSGPALDVDTADRVLEGTRAWLVEPDVLLHGGPPQPPKRLDGHASASAEFYELMARKAESGASEASEPAHDGLAVRILDAIRAKFFFAWQLESQQRFADAEEAYRAVMDIVPDPRSPAYRFAVHRIRILEELKP